MSSQISGRVLLGFCALAVAFLAGVILLRTSAKQTTKTSQDVSAALDALAGVYEFEDGLERMQDACQECLRTPDEALKARCQQKTADLSAHLRSLSVLMEGDALQSENWAALKVQTDTVLQRLEQVLRAPDGHSIHGVNQASNGFEQGVAVVQRVVRRMESVENALLKVSRRDYDFTERQTARTASELVVLQGVTLVLFYVAIRSDGRSRSETGFDLLKSNIQFHAVLGTIGEGFYQLDRDARLVYLNPVGEQILGYSCQEIKGKAIHNVIHFITPEGEPRPASRCPLLDVIRTGNGIRNFEDWFRCKDGSFVAVECTSKPLVIGGRVEGAVLCFRDITERRRIEGALRESEERYRTLVEKSQGLICTHDLAGKLLSINEAAAQVFGKPAEELMGRDLQEFLVPKFREQFKLYLEKIVDWGVHRGLMRVLDQHGDELVWAYSNRLIRDEGSEPYVLGHAQDVTVQIHAERELRASLADERNLSRIDFLTGIANRRAFQESVESEAKRAKRYKRLFTLAYLNIDNFKKVNDGMGHEEGDRLLRKVAQIIRRLTRETDLSARLGGDEFAILYCETDANTVTVAVENLRLALMEMVKSDNWPVSFSIGVRSFRVPVPSADEMIKLTDELMYEVKRKGKNAIAIQA